jgi:hypothetical protein
MASGSIHYKFKSAKTFDTLAFDGSFIAVGELKRLISEKKGLGKDHACELVLTNAQDGSEYDDESALVWKNTSVIVRRVPSMKQAAVGTAHGSEVVKKVVYVAPPDVSQIPSKSVSRRLQMNLNKITKGDGGDEDGNGGDNPLANMAREQAQQWESEKIAANAAAASAGRGARGVGRRGDGPPGPGYICFKCNKGGHWIQDCPLAADTTVEIVRTKHAYGIPQTKLEATTGGILVAPTGESAQMVAAEDEFQKMFGFLAERGNEPLALGNGEEETLALGTGQGEGEGEGAAGTAEKSDPPAPDAPPLPPGFVPPVPMGPPPPGAQKRDAAPAPTAPEPIPNTLDMSALDPMGIMSMDTSIEGLKRMAEQLQKQQDLLDAKSLEVMEMGAAIGASNPMAPPLPAMPPPPAAAMTRDVPTGPPVFEEDDEDTVVMLAGEDDEPEPEPEKKAPPPPPQRSGAPPPPPGRKAAPPPPPAVIPESIAKAHEEALARAMDEGGRTREDSPPPGPRFGGGARPPPRRAVRPDARGRSRRGRADSRERAPAEKRTRDDSRDAGRKRGRDSPDDDENRAKRRNGGNISASMSRENSVEEFTMGSKGSSGGDAASRPRRRTRGGRGRNRGKKREGNGGSGVMSRIG